MILVKGEVLQEMIGKPSTALWNMDEKGRITFIYVFSEEYLSQIKLGGHYDFACKLINNVLFLCIKCGDFDWISAPYSPHLAKEYNYHEYEKGKGKPTTVLVVNNSNGVIEQMDMLGLGTDISNTIEKSAKKLCDFGFDSELYNYNINKTYEMYATDEKLAEEADETYSID